MSHERNHIKGDSKDHHRLAQSESDGSERLSQHVQHLMKKDRSHSEKQEKSSHNHSQGHPYLPEVAIDKDKSKGKSEAKSKEKKNKDETKTKDETVRQPEKKDEQAEKKVPKVCEQPKATDAQAAASEAQEKPKEEPTRNTETMSKKYGVKLTLNSEGKYECVLDGKETKSLGVYDSSPEGLEKLDKALSQKVNEKKVAIEKEFNVKFEGPGHTIAEYADRAREPRLDELDALESALKKSRASIVEPALLKNNLHILFLSEWKEGDPAMQSQSNGTGNRVVVFGQPSRKLKDEQLTDAERQSQVRTVEGDLLHEFSHIGDYTGKNVDYSQIGWKQLEDGNWAKISKDNRLYRWNSGKDENCNAVEEWLEVDTKGTHLNVDNPGARLSNAEMRENSLVKPTSDYFYLPAEDFAEGMERYRRYPESRAQFAKENPELSKYVEQFDKNEIATKLGLGEGNKPLYKRDSSGNIVRDESVAEKSTMTKLQDAVVPYYIYIPQLPLFH